MIDINIEPGCGLVVHKRLVAKDITKDDAVIEYLHSIAIGAERKKDKPLTESEVEWYVNIILNSPEQAEDIGRAFIAAAEEMRKEEANKEEKKKKK